MLLKEFQTLKIGDLVANKKSRRIYKVVDINRNTWQLRVSNRAKFGSFSQYIVVKEDYLLRQIEKVANGVRLTIADFDTSDNKNIIIKLIPLR